MSVCSGCGTTIGGDAQFCGSCGARQSAACSRCSGTLPAGSRFCPGCGVEVVAGAFARDGQPEERKLVTALFCDICDSTGLGERLDPERLEEVMDVYFKAVRKEIDDEGGVVEKFIGDAVMAVFGLPATHEDDPARALRATLGIRRALEELNPGLTETHGVSLEVHIGVNTGEVLVAGATDGEALGRLTGDCLNVAARFEQNAGPGQVLLSERTAAAARGFRYREVGALSLKGKEQLVRTFELLGPSGGADTPALGMTAPLVGRETELELLQRLYARGAAASQPQLVTLYGDSGLGKSRLAQELEAWVRSLARPPAILRSHCLSHGANVTFWPVSDIVRQLSGVVAEDGPEDVAAKVRDLVEGTVGEVAGVDGARVAEGLLGALRGPTEAATSVADAFRVLCVTLARRGPVMVMVDDVQWAEPPMLDLLDGLARHGQGPLFVLTVARGDLLEHQPGWGGGLSSSASVALAPLGPADSARLLEALLPLEDVHPVAEHILDRAEGNPLFIEEIVRHLAGAGLLVREGERWRASAELDDVELPDTVEELLDSRIDRLDPGDKRALQAAAVVGRLCWDGVVSHLMGQTDEAAVRAALDRLEARGFLAPRLGSSLPGQFEYAFRQAAMRQVAYQTIPMRDRSAMHARVAEWLDDVAAPRAEEWTELRAHHYDEAVRWLRHQTGDDPELAERLRSKAFHALVGLAQEARSRRIHDTARRAAEQALALATGESEQVLAKQLMEA